MDRDRKITIQVNMYDGMEVHSLTYDTTPKALFNDLQYELYQIGVPMVHHLRQHEEQEKENANMASSETKKNVSLPIHWIKSINDGRS